MTETTLDFRYRVRGSDTVIRHREPTVGKWYVEMVEDDECMAADINGGCRAGQLAQYIGEGQWDDEGSECFMVDHDFLQEQS